MKTMTPEEKERLMKKPYTHYYYCIKCGRNYGTDINEKLKKKLCPLCSGHNKYQRIVRRIVERIEEKNLK